MCLRPEFATGSANCRQRAAQAATCLTADDTNIEPNLTFLSRDLLLRSTQDIRCIPGIKYLPFIEYIPFLDAEYLDNYNDSYIGESNFLS
jgi:hypothetical protein